MKTNNSLLVIFLCYSTVSESEYCHQECIKKQKLEKLMKKIENDKRPSEAEAPKNR